MGETESANVPTLPISREAHPKRQFTFSKVLNLLLAIAILLVALCYVIQLVQADEDALGLAVTLTGSSITLVSGITALSGIRHENIQASAGDMFSQNWIDLLILLIQVILILVMLLGRQAFFDLLARPKIEAALVETDFIKADLELRDAQSLGANVQDILQEQILLALDVKDKRYSIDDERALFYTRLLLRFSDDSQRAILVDNLLPFACERASHGSPSLTTYVEVLATLNASQATVFVTDLNDAAVMEAAGTFALPANPVCPDVYTMKSDSQIIELLEAVRNFDMTPIEHRRNNVTQSIARYNLALLVEEYDETTGSISRAADLYLEALALDPSNNKARYHLSSLWLRYADRFDNPEETLDRAVEIAYRGWTDFTEDASCLDNPVPDVIAWDCFRLMTVEAGLRLERILRGIPAPEDELGTNALLSMATALAADKGYFEPEHHASEAYYYRAQLDAMRDSVPTLETLCHIIQPAEGDDFRQISRNAYANQIIDQHYNGARCGAN